MRALRRAVAGLLLLAACSKPEPVRIGLVTGLTGRHYDLGLSSRSGALLAISEANARGGIAGRPIEVLIRDDEQSEEVARRAVEELAREGVVAILGHATSAMAAATIEIVNRERVLMVSPTVTGPSFFGKDDWFVMMSPSAADAARALASYVARRAIATRIAVLLDESNRAYSRSFAEAFGAEFEARGGKVAATVPFTSGQVVSHQMLVEGALRSAMPDGVLVVANALDSATLCQQVRKVSKGVAIVGAEWGFTHDALKHGGAALEGAVTVQKVNVDDSESPAFQRFKAAYLERFRRPIDFAAVLSYEAAQVLVEGLRRDPTREGVRRAVLGLGPFPGLQGEIRIDRFGDPKRRLFILGVSEGKMGVVE